MNKRLLFTIFMLISFFSFFKNANAEEEKAIDLTKSFDDFETYNYEVWDTNKGTKVSYKSELDRLISNLDSLGIHYFVSFETIKSYESLKLYGGTNSFNFAIYVFDSNSINLYSDDHSGILFYFSEDKVLKAKVYYFKNTYFASKEMDFLSDYIEQNQSLPNSTITWSESPYSGGTNVTSRNLYPTATTSGENLRLIYKSNMKINFTSKYFDYIKVGTKKYTGIIPTYSEINNPMQGADELGQYIRVPLTDLYKDGAWRDYHKFFRVLNENDDSKFSYNFKIYYEYEVSNLPEFPFSVYINDNLLDPKKYAEQLANGELSSGNGYGGSFSVGAGSFGGESGGGRFDDSACSFRDPLKYSGYLKSSSTFGSIILSVGCSDLSGKTPDDFRTKYIRIYYDAVLYDNIEEITHDSVQDYYDKIKDHYSFLNDDSPLSSFLQPYVNLINGKLPILKQIPELFGVFSKSKQNPNPPDWKINLSGIGIDKTVHMDFTLFDQHRDTIFFIIQLSATYFTIKKILDALGRYFN